MTEVKDQDRINQLAQLLYLNFMQGQGKAGSTVPSHSTWHREAEDFLYPRPPVDPLLRKAREIVAKEFEERGRSISAGETRAGSYDDSVEVRVAFAALTDKPKLTHQEALTRAREAYAGYLKDSGWPHVAGRILSGEYDKATVVQCCLKLQGF